MAYVVQARMQFDIPACISLSGHGPENQVSLFIALVVDHSGAVCARVYKGRLEEKELQVAAKPGDMAAVSWGQTHST
jgi:hypothetical protein